MLLETARSNPASKCFLEAWQPMFFTPIYLGETEADHALRHTNPLSWVSTPYRTKRRNQRSQGCWNSRVQQGDVNGNRQVFWQYPKVDLKAEYISRNWWTRSEEKHRQRPMTTRLRTPLFLGKKRVFDALRRGKQLCGRISHTSQNEGNSTSNCSKTLMDNKEIYTR